MKQSPLNFRDHIKPLFIADTILNLGLLILILLWIFGDDQNFLGGFLYNEKALIMGIGLGLAFGGGFLLAIAVRNLIKARQTTWP